MRWGRGICTSDLRGTGNLTSIHTFVCLSTFNKEQGKIYEIMGAFLQNSPPLQQTNKTQLIDAIFYLFDTIMTSLT